MMNDSVLFSTFLTNSGIGKMWLLESNVHILPCLWHSPQGTFWGFVLPRRPARVVFFVRVVLSWPMTIVAHLPASRGFQLVKNVFL